MVFLVEREGEIKSMIDNLENYFGGKGLELHVEKTQLVRFRKEGGKQRSFKWKWKGKSIKEVKEYEYLSYKVQTNERQDRHVRDRMRKAAMVMGQVWTFGRRKFGKNINRRFDEVVV